MITKRDLRIGNMFEQGIVWKISGRAGAKVHLHGKGKWYKGFRSEVDVEKLKPIVLTEDILTDWCGMNYHDLNGDTGHYQKKVAEGKPIFEILWGEEAILYDYKVEIKYLHELQNLYKVITKQELEIKG